MSPIRQIKFLLQITRTHGIIRRYFVVNGFDGALTMLGLIIGFMISTPAELSVIINACVGAAVALGMSGVSSAYISEKAERRRELIKLQEAMVADLQQSAHGVAARWVPMLIALVNGLAPAFISLLIITPMWLAERGVALPVSPLYASIIIGMSLIFMLGIFLGRIANISWIRSGMQTLLVAIITAALIYVLASD